MSASTPPATLDATFRPPAPLTRPENVEAWPSASIVPAPVSVTARPEAKPDVVFSVPPLKVRPLEEAPRF